VEPARWLIEHLLEAERTDRGVRSISYQMHAARFPVHRDLAGFDFEQSKVDRGLISELSSLDFTEAAHNVVFIGGTGTGKTHLAAALGVSGITQHGKRVRFYSTVDLVNALEQEKAAGKSGRLAFNLMRIDLLILDELGYLPFTQTGGALLFHLLSKLYERTSVMITTNLTFADPHDVLEFNPELSESFILLAITGLQLLGERISDFQLVFSKWSVIRHPELYQSIVNNPPPNRINIERPNQLGGINKKQFFDAALLGLAKARTRN
jgi:DNA replication protein DnaC